MNPDPIVDEIRQTRKEHAARFHYDLKAICEDLRKEQESYGMCVATLPPKKLREGS